METIGKPATPPAHFGSRVFSTWRVRVMVLGFPAGFGVSLSPESRVLGFGLSGFILVGSRVRVRVQGVKGLEFRAWLFG